MPRLSPQHGLLALFMLGILSVDLPGAEPPVKTPAPAEKANPKPSELKPKAEKPGAVKLSDANAPSEAEIRKALETSVSLDYDADPLNVVLRTIALDAKVNILLDDPSLTEEGVSIEEPITLKNEGISAARVLDRLLNPLGLTWFIEDHVVLVTTFLIADEKFKTVTYSVGDLIEYEKDHRPDAAWAADAGRLEDAQFGGECGGVYPCAGSDTEDRRGKWLIRLLETMTKPYWPFQNQRSGSVSLLGNRLVVRKTHHVQEEVEQLILAVRQFTQGELKSNPVSIRPPHYPVQEDAAVRKALKRVISLHCKELPLNEFVADVGRTLEIPVHIEERALNEEGIAVEEPISWDLENLPAESIVKIALEPFGLVGIVEEGQLLVTTIISADERDFTKLHDIRDLQGDFTSRELIDLLVEETSGPWYIESGGGAFPLIPLDGLLVVRQTEQVHNEIEAILSDLRKQMADAPAKPEKAKPVNPQAVATKFYALHTKADPESVRTAVQTLVEPKSWAKNGGEGEIVLIGRQLVVKHKSEVQARVNEFLTELRERLDAEDSGTGRDSPK